MRPLADLDAERAGKLAGVIFDLDGTVLSDGRLTREALAALWDMSDAGLRLIACTGRSAGWGQVVARQWPIDVAIVENGALAYTRQGAGVRQLDRLRSDQRAVRRSELADIVAQLRERFDDALLADDNLARISDTSFDIGEVQQLPPARVAELVAAAEALGARTFVSSIHLHLTLDSDDKASGTLRVLRELFSDDEVGCRQHYAFVGDSSNDAACFAAFDTSIGVANIRPHIAQLTVPPSFVTQSADGAGFAEFARHLLAKRP
jgi:HAD superfamily hydrolase (TIGR01484 family)